MSMTVLRTPSFRQCRTRRITLCLIDDISLTKFSKALFSAGWLRSLLQPRGPRFGQEPAHGAGNVGQLIGYERARALRLIGEPVADRITAKYRQVEAATRRRYDLSAEFPQKRMGSAEAIFGNSFGAPPFDCPPLQQIVGTQLEGAF